MKRFSICGIRLGAALDIFSGSDLGPPIIIALGRGAEGAPVSIRMPLGAGSFGSVADPAAELASLDPAATSTFGGQRPLSADPRPSGQILPHTTPTCPLTRARRIWSGSFIGSDLKRT